MPVKVHSSGVVGIEAHAVEVEIDISPGVYGYDTVGLPDTAVRESKQRVKSAIKNGGFRFPQEKVVVNLCPADIRKEGTAYDLPIALGIIQASGQAPGLDLEGTVVIGELGLSGAVRPVPGILAVTIDAKARQVRRMVVPEANASEAASVEGVTVIPAATLAEVVEVLRGQRPARMPQMEVVSAGEDPPVVDLAFVRGQRSGRRAIEIAAAGGHHVLLTGPPGTGKTLLARCLHGVLPDLDSAERLEVSRVYSVAGQLHRGRLVGRRPFRAPHHTASCAAIVGGGTGLPRPGEVSLAHTGVLFLDEFPEFDRGVREVLRQPLESGEVVIARSSRTVRFPARFQLIATMNPCPCGYADVKDAPKACRCDPRAVERYQLRVSGPLRDRFDLHVMCPPVPKQLLLSDAAEEPTSTVRARVTAARERQTRRYAGAGFRCNAEVQGDAVRALCRLDDGMRTLIGDAMDRSALSARGFHRAIRVARTIADLEGCELVERRHFAEALVFRCASTSSGS